MQGEADVARAERAYVALVRDFAHDDGSALFRDDGRDGPRRYAHLWPCSQAAVAACLLGDLSALHALDAYREPAGAVAGYASAVLRPYGRGGDKYYDDNAWVTLAFLYAFERSRDVQLVATARSLFEFLSTGWDDDTRHSHPGGVFWTQAQGNRDRNTVSTAPTAQVALRLHELTGEPRYREWAVRAREWLAATLRDPDDGLYWDHITLDGSVDTRKWSYNQGAVVAVHALLGELEIARELAQTALAHYGRVGYFTQPCAFNAIFFRDVLTSVAASHDEALQHVVSGTLGEYADALWSRHRDEGDRIRFENSESELLDQAAAVQVFVLAMTR